MKQERTLEFTESRPIFICGSRVDSVREIEMDAILANEEHCDFDDNLAQIALADVGSDFVALHGVITPASELPPEMFGEAYIIITDDNDDGCIFELPSDATIETVAETIAEIMEIFPAINIEDIYVFYGYELFVSPTIHPDAIDTDKFNKIVRGLSHYVEIESQSYATVNMLTGELIEE